MIKSTSWFFKDKPPVPKDLFVRFDKTCFIVKHNKNYSAWVPNTCFIVKHNKNYSTWVPNVTEWDTYESIKYSGMFVNLDSQKILYECLIDNEVQWVDVSQLRFPQHETSRQL